MPSSDLKDRLKGAQPLSLAHPVVLNHRGSGLGDDAAIMIRFEHTQALSDNVVKSLLQSSRGLRLTVLRSSTQFRFAQIPGLDEELDSIEIKISFKPLEAVPENEWIFSTHSMPQLTVADASINGQYYSQSYDEDKDALVLTSNGEVPPEFPDEEFPSAMNETQSSNVDTAPRLWHGDFVLCSADVAADAEEALVVAGVAGIHLDGAPNEASEYQQSTPAAPLPQQPVYDDGGGPIHLSMADNQIEQRPTDPM
ncbi:hypothetical protein RQP46_007426 [Phenoliferia psychrophenolica]